MSRKQDRENYIRESRAGYALMRRENPLPLPGPIRVSNIELLNKLNSLGHPVELITPDELPAALDRARDPDEDQTLR